MNARRWLLALLGLLLAACEEQAPPRGFAGLGGAAEGFAQVRPGTPLRFPRDHGAHADVRIEWWYLTANLEDRQGRAWGLQWTLFRTALRPDAEQPGWASRQLWMGHAALTGPHGHRHAQTLARGGIGQAGVTSVPFEAWIDDWSLRAVDQNSPGLAELVLSARGEGFAYRLRLSGEGPPVLHGEQGYSRKSAQGQASYYYSLPFLRAQGRVEVDGEGQDVIGQAWLDREWSSQPLAAEQRGWDWFSLHLEGGAKLMLFRLRQADGEAYSAGTWIHADGTAEALQGQDIQISPRRYGRVAGRRLPLAWTLKIASKQLAIDTEPLQEQAWMATQPPYWEGPIRVAGSHRGVGYLEMTGY